MMTAQERKQRLERVGCKNSLGAASAEIAGIPRYPSPITSIERWPMRDEYSVCINGEQKGKPFPYTVDGFVMALEQAEKTTPPFRLDQVKVINLNRVDLDNSNGLTANEEAVADLMLLGAFI